MPKIQITNQTNRVLLAISGRKQSGKSSTSDYIKKIATQSGDTFVREFSFADPLKKMCVEILGLEPCQVYGSDEQKNSPVPHLLWENFPVQRRRIAWRKTRFGLSYPYLRKGPMTGREVMQFVGTDIFRKAFLNVWAQAAVNAVVDWFDSEAGLERYTNKGYANLVAVMPDCRFPNEVRAVKDAGGHVLRLTRNPFPEDTHPSEVALDPDNYDQSNFSLVYDNSNQSVNEQMNGLKRWLWQINAISLRAWKSMQTPDEIS